MPSVVSVTSVARRHSAGMPEGGTIHRSARTRALTLHTHMRMSGSWHLYRPGQPWQRPPGRASVVLEVPGWIAVCFWAPVCELLDAAQVAGHPGLAGRGPDAVSEGADLAGAHKVRAPAEAGALTVCAECASPAP